MIFNLQKLKEARDSGISDDEIWSHVSQSDPRFSQAKEEGLSLDEIADHFSKRNPIKDYNYFASIVDGLAKSQQQNYARYQELFQSPERTSEQDAEMVDSWKKSQEAKLNFFKERKRLEELRPEVDRFVEEQQKEEVASIEVLGKNPDVAPLVPQLLGLRDQRQARIAEINQTVEDPEERNKAIQQVQADYASGFKGSLEAINKASSDRMARLNQVAGALKFAEERKTEEEKLKGVVGARGVMVPLYVGEETKTQTQQKIDQSLSGIPIEEQEQYKKEAQLILDLANNRVSQGIVNNSLEVSPSILFDDEAVNKAVAESEASDTQKEAFQSSLPQLRKAVAEGELPALSQWSEFNDFVKENNLQDATPFEKVSKFKNADRNWFSKAGMQTKIGLAQAHESMVGQIQATIGSGLYAYQQSGLATDPEKVYQLSQAFAAAAGDQQQKVEDLGVLSQAVGGPTYMADIANTGYQMVPVVASSFGVGLAAGGVGMTARLASNIAFATAAGAAGLQSYASTYMDATETVKDRLIKESIDFAERQLLDQGVTPEEARKQAKSKAMSEDKAREAAMRQAYLPAVVSGLATATITALGGKFGPEAVTKEVVLGLAKNQGYKQAVKGFLRDVAINAGVEIPEEAADQFVQGVTTKLTYEPDKTMGDIVVESLYAGGMGAVFGAGGGVIEYAAKKKSNRLADEKIARDEELKRKQSEIDGALNAAQNASSVAPASADAVAQAANQTQANVNQEAAQKGISVEESGKKPIRIPATFGPFAIREGESEDAYWARIDAIASETPEQRVARLQQEAKAAAEIPLEEEIKARFLDTAKSIIEPQIEKFDIGKLRSNIALLEEGILNNTFKIEDFGKTQFKSILSPDAYTQIVNLFEEDPQAAIDALKNIFKQSLGGGGGGGGGEGETEAQIILREQAKARITEREGQAVTPVETPTGNRVEAAAYQAPDGTVYYGASHLDAMAKARDAGKIDQAAIDAKQEVTSRETPEFGFATNADPFVSRDQAETIARQSGQITVEQPATGKLHSNEVSLDAFAQPVVTTEAPVTPTAAPAAVEPTPVTPPPVTPEVAARPKVTPEERIAKLDRLKEVKAEIEKIQFKPVEGAEVGLSGLTTEEAKRYSALMMEAEGIRFDLRKELKVEKIEPEKERKSAIPPDIIKTASDELASDRGVWSAITEAAIGTFKNMDTAVDIVMDGKNPDVSPSQLYNAFNNTREALRQKFGDTIKLYRAVGKQKPKATTNWLSTKEAAMDYGNNIVEKEIPIDDIVALNVGLFGRYEEFIIGKKPAAEVAPAVTPQLEPLRRVAKAEQTKEDVAGLVDAGFVELYKGQPVLTQAGLEALPEAERPRLTPEARKIQIDTRTSEAAAEAISKNLRIGVDQVPVDVRMPAGWTLVGDVYVPPTPIPKIETFDVEALAEVDEDSDVFADVIKRKDEAKAAVAQKPEGSAFATQEEFRAAFDLRGEGHGRFATRLDLMVADGVITSEGRDLIMAVIYDNNTDDTFLNNMEMGSMRARATRSYGLGGVSRQTVQSAKGKAIGYKPLLKMMQNARRDLQIDEKTAQTLSTFWHEFGHAGYYSLLDKAQKSVVASAYRKTTKAQRIKFFESGVAAARQSDVTAQYYAKSETEWFAQSFAEYVLTQKSEQKALVPIFETILNKIKGVFGKLFSRKEGTPELNDIFEYIIQGKGYGSTKIWWNGLQLSLAPAVYGTRGAQPIDPDFSRRLVEREKQNRAKARRSISAPEAREARREPTITPQQDRDYLDAVERGDLDAASRLVEDAASKAGFTSPTVFHGSIAKGVTRFDVGQAVEVEGGIFFTTNEDVAAQYTFERAYGEIISDEPLGEVTAAKLRMDNPFEYQAKGKIVDAVEMQRVIDKAKADGFDGVIIRNIDDSIGMTGDMGDVYVVFNGNQIKSADPATYDDQGNIIPLSQRFQPEQADIRYNPLGYDITTVVEDIKAGRTDGPLKAVNNVVKEASALRDRVKAESLRRQQPRARGKAAILERIARERSSGKLSEETAQALSDFVNSIRNEAIGDTAISIRGAGGASNFDFGQSLVSFFLTQDQPKIGARVGIHEFWHGLARFLPQKEADQMTKDYTKALGAYLKKNPWFLAFVGRYSLTPEQFEAYKIFNPKEAETKLVPVLDREGNPVKYQIKYDADNYRYIMLDEWIAEKMTDLVRGKQAIPDTFMGKLAKIIRDFMAMIRSKLGRDPYQSFYNLVTDPNQKIDLQRMAGVARPFQIYQPQDYDYSKDISDQIRFAPMGAEGREYRAEGFPTFTEGTPESATLKEMEASMAKVDAASEAKGGKPETYKISEIASVWMDSGLGERELQDAIVEYTNLTPANAARVAKAIAKQYGLQQQIAETGAVITEIAPEPEGAPRKSAVTKLIEQTTGVRKPVVKLQVSESAALKKQIQLKAREARETRKARKEAAEELAKSITDYVKANPIRGPINSRQAMSITKKALKLDVNNEAAVDRFEMYVERVIENANYDRDLADARALIKRAKAFAKSKDTQGNVKTTLEAIANISPTLLNNPFEFNLVVQRYLLGLAPVTAKQYAVMPDADVRRYLESLETQIKDNQEVLDRAKAQRILDKQAAYAEEKGIPLDEAISILNSEEFLQEKTIEKLEDLTKLLTAMAQESQKDVKAYDDSGATPKQKELISFMRKVNLDSLINEEKKRYIRFANNLLANGATFGMEQFQSIALGQEAAMKAAKDKRLSNKLAAWISPIGGDKAIDTARRIAAKTQSEADTFKNIFGREAVGAFRNILGLNRLDVAQTDSNRAKEQIANEFGEYFKGLRKKYGDDATGFEAKGYAGIAGYLIQTDGNKTESESIPYRRRLMEQNIVELRKSDKQADLAEADLKERALAQLTGTTNAEILSQLRALNPASYEQLMWVKDVMLPKWRDFLKEHDENFRNQANNYNNPDHLTITYKFPEGQLLPSEMEDVYQQDMIGMRIKQAANSIKRKDHPNLPVSKAGTIANIDINFGYNQYNALVDQVDKAFVAPAWEQVVAFTKAPEFEQVMGGRANALFVKNLLRDIQTSRSRQSLTDDEAQLIAGGVRLARKISTQAVLGGFTQPLRQVPDQLSKLFFTTGRFDLITKNLLTTAQAAPLLNKFPISRRGDAQAGTQYASQFSELARKVEASVTDRKWAQYRELMNKVGEFWMTPLRGSDVWAAKVSWMSYYEAELNKKGIKMESWEREAELVDTDQDRKEAAAYAEFAVDFYGGASDPTKMAALSKQSNNGWKEFAKLVFLPLNSFALQQKNSLISDLRDAYLRTGDRKASIAAIAGTLAGMAAFHGMRIYIIGGLLYPAGKALLMGIFGIDMDEPDEEEKQKQLEDNWRKFKASIYGNIIAGGAGEFAEKAAIDAVNRTAYLWDANINPDSLLNEKGEIMSFRQYEKEVSPLYRFRSYGSSEYSFGLADVLTEQATHALAETQQLMTPEEMEKYTGNEQAYAAFATGVEWMYFFRLMDTDVKRIATDLKRQMDKEVKEREAELKRIREGR